MNRPVISAHETDPAMGLSAASLAEHELSSHANAVLSGLMRSRDYVEDLRAQGELLEKVYVNGFLGDVDYAARVAIALGEGRFNDVVFDSASLFGHETNAHEVAEYLRGFIPLDPTVQLDAPRIHLQADAAMRYNSRDMYREHSSSVRPLGELFSPSFTNSIRLPMLIDTTPRTLREFAELETVDPAHAMQLTEAYRMAVEAYKQGDGTPLFGEPVVIRAVSVVPVGPDYATDFLPHIEKKNDQGESPWDWQPAWKPKLLVNGALNESSGYLEGSWYGKKTAVQYRKPNGQSANLRARAASPLEEDIHAVDAPLEAFVPSEQNTIGVILLPYQRKLRAPTSYSVAPSKGSGGPERSSGIGSAVISAGGSGFARATDSGEYGYNYHPLKGGRPIVYSVRILTANRRDTL